MPLTDRSAEEAVEAGYEEAERGRIEEALALFRGAREASLAEGSEAWVAECDDAIGILLSELPDERDAESAKRARQFALRGLEGLLKDPNAAGLNPVSRVALGVVVDHYRAGRDAEALEGMKSFVERFLVGPGGDPGPVMNALLPDMGGGGDEAAREPLYKIELRSRRAHRLLNSGREGQARPLLGTIQEYYESLGLHELAAPWNKRLGRAFYRVEDYGAALERFEAARSAYEMSGDRAKAASCEQQMSAVLNAVGLFADAETHLRAALEYFRSSDDPRGAAYCANNLGNTLVQEGRYDDGLSRLRDAEAYLSRHVDTRDDAAMCNINIVIALGLVPFADRIELHTRLADARANFESNDLLDGVARCDLIDCGLSMEMDEHEDALALATRARESFSLQTMTSEVAYCDLTIGEVHLRMGNRSDALTSTLRAVLALDGFRYTLRESPHRFAWSRRHAVAYDKALWLAHEVGDSRLVAELVESARVQGLPAPAATASDNEGGLAFPIELSPDLGESGTLTSTYDPAEASLSAALSAAGLTPLTPPAWVDLIDDGDSELTRRVPDSEREGRVCLARVAEAVAGQAAWRWWGSWVAGAWLYWSLVGHDGTVEAGQIGVSDLVPVLDQLDRAIPRPRDGESRADALYRAESGALSERESEAALSRDLGALLVPGSLRRLLLETDAAHPMALVVAPAPLLGRVPFGLLGLDDGADPVRVGERAVLRVGASVALLAAVTARKPEVAIPDEVAAVVDAGGARLFEGEIPLEPWFHRVLTRKTRMRILEDALVPVYLGTRENLAAALATAAGVLAYVGHVDMLGEDLPAAAHLVLADGPFTARDWLRQAGTYPAPARVLLLACASSGAGSPEWLGLAPAALWAGATMVVATSWELPTRTAWPLANELVQLLRGSDAVASDLQKAFRAHLAHWREGTDVVGPLGWASLQLVGIG